MRFWPDSAARVAFFTLLVALAWYVLRNVGWLPGDDVVPIVLGVVAGAVLAATQWSRRYWQRVTPVFDEEFPGAGKAFVARDGRIEWTPPATSQIGIRHGIVHRWWDAERGARYDAAVAFDIPDEVAPKDLEGATDKALKAAARALPGRGKVRAKAAARDEPGPTSLVRVRLSVRGPSATPDWARAAGEAFARAFLRELKDDGHIADRR